MNRPQPWRVKLAAQKLNQGEVIAYPTEGVWGLGCLPGSEAGVAKILKLKQRPWQKGLILVAANIEQILPYVSALSASQLAQLASDWPAPLTYLIDKSALTPLWVSGDHEKVAVRVSDHPVIQALCLKLGSPLVSTSANPAGKAAALNRTQLRAYFGDDLDYVFPGELGSAEGASEIRDLASGKVLRAAE